MLSNHAVHAGEDIKQSCGGRLSCVDCRVDRLSPQLNRDLVRHELAFAGIFKKGLADFCARVDRAEYIAAGAMIKARNRAEGFSLRALAASRRAKKDKRVVLH